MLDEKGRCCGRKPISYKGGAWNSPPIPQRFCARCDRAYDIDNDHQIENWAWKKNGKVFSLNNNISKTLNTVGGKGDMAMNVEEKQARINQRYTVEKCATCADYKSEFTKTKNGGFISEINKKCGIGGFPVRKTGVCNMWTMDYDKRI